ncbi:MAG: DNA helicase RecQ [Bacillota bacterium]
MDRAKKILKDTFGYNEFRPLQSEIIQNILNRKDTLVVMPTGGGKSICYQIPALIFNGLTVIVSPLISLMKDQVEQLRLLGINAAQLNNSISSDEYRTTISNIRNGKAKLLYLAPESLFKDEIQELLSEIKIDAIAVDEAHCISEWGHDFRPEYRQLGLFRKRFPDAVCIGLTATATPTVQDDIVNNLNMKLPRRFIASFNRTNLFLRVIAKNDPFKQTVEFLKEYEGQSGIIYCFSRKQVDVLTSSLDEAGFSVKPYHAGLSDQERAKNQEMFLKDEIQIIIATIAFGMGINKSNVRFVLHYDLPKNIESYYQEIGRSGRDGLKSDCLLLFSYGDIAKFNYFIEQKEEFEKLVARIHLDAMVRYAEAHTCRRISLINYFGEHYNEENCGMCDNCLSEKKDLTDVTIPAQKFLSAVKRTGEIFGAVHIIDVLLGSEAERIFMNNHQNLPVYGIGKELNKSQWQKLSRQLLSANFLRKDMQYGGLKLTRKANDVLFKNEKVYADISTQEEKIRKIRQTDQKYDEVLFDILRKKRKQLADEQNVPPYVVFSDKVLTALSAFYPSTSDELLDIQGIGNVKAQKYGEIFLEIINNYCRTNNIKRKERD